MQMLYFGNPDDHGRRANFSIHSSSDGGLLWESVSDVFAGGAAYSDLSITRQGDIAFFFERGPYDRDPYAWLTFGKISPKGRSASAHAAGRSMDL
jgi:sialidase-1